MELKFSPAVAKELASLPTKEAKAIVEKLKAVAANPFASYSWATRLQGGSAYRLRQGDWRALYQIDRETQTVTVERVGHRKDVYK